MAIDLSNTDDAGKTLEFWLAAIQQQRDKFLQVPEYLITDEFLLAAAQKNGMVLKYIEFTPDIPEQPHNDLEICLAAVRQNGRALRSVPEALQEQVKQTVGIDKKF